MMTKQYTYIVSAILLVSVLAPLTAGAYYYPTEPHLVLPGVDDVQPVYNGTIPAPKPVSLNFDIFGNSSTATNSTSSTSTATKSSGSIFGNLFGGSSSTVAHDAAGNQIILVSADNTNVYAIMNGEKHLIPNNPDILAAYGYQASLVQPVTQAQLDKYPRASLITVKGDASHVYYLTQGNMTRLMSTKVMDSYGVRAQDAVTISKLEFNYYPQDQYVYLGSPLNRDVFQIVGTGKRYLTPMAVERLGISADQVAPVNQAEMDSYKILAPVVQ